MIPKKRTYKSLKSKRVKVFYRDGSHRHNFGGIFLAHKTPSYDTKMLLRIVFDKTEFVEFKTSNSLKQNMDETHSKNP